MSLNQDSLIECALTQPVVTFCSCYAEFFLLSVAILASVAFTQLIIRCRNVYYTRFVCVQCSQMLLYNITYTFMQTCVFWSIIIRCNTYYWPFVGAIVLYLIYLKCVFITNIR